MQRQIKGNLVEMYTKNKQTQQHPLNLTYHEIEFDGRKITDKTQFPTEFNN